MIAPLAALLRYHELNTAQALPAEGVKASHSAEASRLLQAMTPNLQRQYLKVAKRYGVTAIAPAERGVCTACSMRQPKGAVELDYEVTQCQNCGRLLYDPDAAYEYSVG